MTTFYKRITGSKIQGDGSAVIEQEGTLVVNADGTVHLHDGTTTGGNPITGGAGGIPLTGNTYNLNDGASLDVNVSGSGAINLLSNGLAGIEISNVTRIYANNQYAEMQESGAFAIPGTLASSSNTGDVTINSSNGTLHTWTFGSDGNLSLPGSLQTSGHVVAGGAGYLDLNGTGNISLNGLTGSNVIMQTTGDGSTFNNWSFNNNATLHLPQGSVISETSSTTIITPPTASSGQSLVIRPTNVGVLSASGYIVPGTNLTITLTNSTGALNTSTVGYIITGATAEELGISSLTGTFDAFSPNDSLPQTTSIVLPIPSNSTASTLTLTITGSNPWVDSYLTVTDNGVSETSHIHLIAGDHTTTDIFLGDDDQYVKVAHTGDIGLRARDDTGGTGGRISLSPGGGEGGGPGPNGGNIDISAGYDLGSLDDPQNALDQQYQYHGYYHGGQIRLNTRRYGGSTTSTWAFDVYGALKLPQGGTNTTSSLGQGPDSDWVNPNNNTWSIRTYNGAVAISYNSGDAPTIWWSAENSPLGASNFRGAIIEYHAYGTGNSGGLTVIGSVILSRDNYGAIEATHTENILASPHIGASLSFWSVPSPTQLGYSNSALISGQTDNIMIQWTSRVFYGLENFC